MVVVVDEIGEFWAGFILWFVSVNEFSICCGLWGYFRGLPPPYPSFSV